MSYSHDPDTPNIRTCDRPGCTAAYDALKVMLGEASARGWLSYATFHLHMCPQHAYLFGERFHRPMLDRTYGTTACSCGTPLQWDPCPIAWSAAAYRNHLKSALTLENA